MTKPKLRGAAQTLPVLGLDDALAGLFSERSGSMYIWS